MTTLYRTVPIKTVEQAGALPAGTIALHEWGHGTTAYTLTSGRWVTSHGTAVPHSEVVGWTALVPVEAEEEWGTQHDGGDPHADGTQAEAHAASDEWRQWGDEPPRVIRRLVTPWEAA